MDNTDAVNREFLLAALQLPAIKKRDGMNGWKMECWDELNNRIMQVSGIIVCVINREIMESREQQMDLLSLPVVMIENIISYLPFDEIAKKRLVSSAFNEVCMRMLNRGFLMIERRHALALKSVKAQLPRRESERRYHHLSRHCDILTSIETRISMLNMTYSKFIDNGLCCFIPGKVIDEIRRVLTIVETSITPPRAHEVLQELRDISSMAIEHFDDKISPAFRKRLQQAAHPPTRPTHAAVLAPMAMRQEMLQLRRRTVINAKRSLYLSAQYKKFFKRMMEYSKLAWRQQRTIRDMTKRQREQDNAIADLKKRIEECDIKYSELTHTNQAVGGKSVSAGEGSASTQPLRHFSSQIKLDMSVLPIGTNKRNHKLSNMKPRKPVIKLPSLSEDTEPSLRTEDPEESRAASTSKAPMHSPKSKCQSMANIRGITNDMRQSLSNLTKNVEGKLKRSISALDLSASNVDSKKQKLD